ncbi:MAG: hypothetical protein IKP40_03515 [Clostridia bacterium]|nr:hypothetical protein [Clostridia bacterium]
MIKLMKYELRKTLSVKLILLAVTAVAELVYLIGLWRDSESMIATGIGLLLLLAFSGVMIVGIGTLLVLHRDINTKQSCMLFMTPHSSYAILGAKLLENAVSILLAGVFFFALGALDVTLLFAHQKALDQMWKMISEMLRSFNEELVINQMNIAALVWAMLTSWITTVTTACLADVVSAALLGGKKLSGFISLLLFIALSLVEGQLLNLIFKGMTLDFATASWLRGGAELLIAIGTYVLTAFLMERRLSV